MRHIEKYSKLFSQARTELSRPPEASLTVTTLKRQNIYLFRSLIVLCLVFNRSNNPVFHDRCDVNAGLGKAMKGIRIPGLWARAGGFDNCTKDACARTRLHA